MIPAWDAALRVAELLARRPATRAVAVIGSLARGAFVDGSDVDLWVLGGRCRQRDIVVDGAAIDRVSVLETDAAFEASPELFLRFEVARAVPLFDPRGTCAALQRRARRDADDVAAAQVEASRAALRFLLAKSRRGSRAMRVAALREWARRAAALRVLVDHGLRVPRWRDFALVLPRTTARLLEQAVHLPSTAGLIAALRAARRAGDVVDGMPLPNPAQVGRYLEAGRAFDAVVAVRQGLPPAPQASAMGPAHERLFALAQGFDGFEVAPQPAVLRRQAELASALAAAVDVGALGVPAVPAVPGVVGGSRARR